MQAVIFAGGLGTRLRPLTNNVPKPMVSVNGKPFLEYEIKLFKKNGITDLVLCVGYLSNVITDYFGDGSKFGVRITYSYESDRLLGPAGALKMAEPLLGDAFLVANADSYMQMDYQRAMEKFEKSTSLGMMVVYKNHNRYGRSDLAVKDGFVVKYNKHSQTPDMIWINFGISALKKKALQLITPNREFGEEEFYDMLIKRGELLAFETYERFYEIGTIQALREFEEMLSVNIKTSS